MSKSGQPSTKSDTGGQRVPASESKTQDQAKKAEKPSEPVKKASDKKK